MYFLCILLIVQYIHVYNIRTGLNVHRSEAHLEWQRLGRDTSIARILRLFWTFGLFSPTLYFFYFDCTTFYIRTFYFYDYYFSTAREGSIDPWTMIATFGCLVSLSWLFVLCWLHEKERWSNRWYLTGSQVTFGWLTSFSCGFSSCRFFIFSYSLPTFLKNPAGLYLPPWGGRGETALLSFK